jgi:hypothetical protein
VATGRCRPWGAGGCPPPPLLENFQFFPAKIADFIEKKDHQIEKIGIAPPHFKKIVYAPSQLSKISFAPPHFFLCGTSLYTYNVFDCVVFELPAAN